MANPPPDHDGYYWLDDGAGWAVVQVDDGWVRWHGIEDPEPLTGGPAWDPDHDPNAGRTWGPEVRR